MSTRTGSVAVYHWAVQTPWKPQWVNVRKLIGTNNIYTAFRFLSDKRLKIIKIYRLNRRQSLCTNKKLFFLIYVYVHSRDVRVSHTPIPQDYKQRQRPNGRDLDPGKLHQSLWDHHQEAQSHPHRLTAPYWGTQDCQVIFIPVKGTFLNLHRNTVLGGPKSRVGDVPEKSSARCSKPTVWDLEETAREAVV